MRAGWKILCLAAVIFAVAFGLAQWLVPGVVPVGYAEEPQESWAVLTAFLLRAIELVAAWVSAIVLAVMCAAWARDRLRQPLSSREPVSASLDGAAKSSGSRHPPSRSFR